MSDGHQARRGKSNWRPQDETRLRMARRPLAGQEADDLMLRADRGSAGGAANLFGAIAALRGRGSSACHCEHFKLGHASTRQQTNARARNVFHGASILRRIQPRFSSSRGCCFKCCQCVVFIITLRLDFLLCERKSTFLC